ncbi:MAG: ROK family transcriptional regulator [Pseudomonadota bacterium]
MQGGSTSELRRRNRDVVLREIASQSAVSRSQIARSTGLTGAAVSRITRELIDAGLVREGRQIETKGQAGRRNVCLELGYGGAFVLAVVLTANIKSVSLSDCRGEIVAQDVLAGLDHDDPDHVIAELCRAAESLIGTSGIDRTRLVGCGISVAGVTEPDGGRLVKSEPLGWEDVRLGPAFSAALGLPVRVERRAAALLTAEVWRGAARGKRNVVLINNGLWLGGCMLADGQVLTGTENQVGQLAHMAAGARDVPCACGRKGCLDVVASGWSVVKALEGVAVPGSDQNEERGARLRTLARYAGEDHPEISDAFRNAGRRMGYAVDHLFALFYPELVLLAGETSRNPHFLGGVLETLAELRPSEEDWPVQVSDITSDMSAVWIGLDAFVFSRMLDIDKLMAA